MRGRGRLRAAQEGDGPEQFLAQLPFEDLARRVAGEGLVPEPDVGRHHEAGQPLADVRRELLGAHLVAGPEDHDGAHLLAQCRIGDADHGAVGHGGVLEQRRLDLHRVDVLAAPDDHVLGPIDDVDEVVRIEPGDVAGVEPARG